MAYRKTYNEILEMVEKTVLFVPMARAIVRRSGFRPGGGASGGGPTTPIRRQYWNQYSGTDTDPVGGDNYFVRFSDDGPVVISLYFGNTVTWLEGVTEVRINAATFETHPTALILATWIVNGAAELDRYFPDTGSIAGATLPGEPFDTELICGLSQTYNTSGWVPFLPSWLEQDVYMQLEIGGVGDGSLVKLGLCELQLR